MNQHFHKYLGCTNTSSAVCTLECESSARAIDSRHGIWCLSGARFVALNFSQWNAKLFPICFPYFSDCNEIKWRWVLAANLSFSSTALATLHAYSHTLNVCVCAQHLRARAEAVVLVLLRTANGKCLACIRRCASLAIMFLFALHQERLGFFL